MLTCLLPLVTPSLPQTACCGHTAALEQQGNAARMREAALLRRVAWLETQAASRQDPAAQVSAAQQDRHRGHSCAAQLTADQPARNGLLQDGAVQATIPQLDRHSEEIKAKQSGAVVVQQLGVKADGLVLALSAQHRQDGEGP